MSKIYIALIAFLVSNLTFAYDCPSSNSAAGGWVPEFCADASNSSNSGTVISVQKKEVEDASGIGAAVGAVAGGVVGNTVSGKKSKTLGTVIGAVAGGVAGHYGEKYLKKKTIWEVNVKLLDGSEKKFEFDADPGLVIGDEVFVSGNSAYKKIR